MFKKLFSRPRAVIVKYPAPMKTEEVVDAFQSQGKDTLIWQAIDTVIDNHLLDAVNDVSDPQLNSTALAHTAGRVDAISTLKSKIEEYKKWKNGKMSYKQN